jgi:hypothetical protein
MSTHSETPLAKKIRALMAKANDPGVGEHEASAFMNKVQELLVKNGLSMSDVKEADVERGDVEGHKYPSSLWKSPSRRSLLRMVCRFYMCEAIGPGPRSTTWHIIGRKHNVEVAVSMTEYLVQTTVRLSNAWGRQNIGANVIDFRKGCMLRLEERLHEKMTQAKAEKPVWNGANPGNLPALFVGEKQLIENYKKAKMNIKYGKARPIKAGYHGLEAGRAAGGGISLQGQVGAGQAGRLAIGKG